MCRPAPSNRAPQGSPSTSWSVADTKRIRQCRSGARRPPIRIGPGVRACQVTGKRPLQADEHYGTKGTAPANRTRSESSLSGDDVCDGSTLGQARKVVESMSESAYLADRLLEQFAMRLPAVLIDEVLDQWRDELNDDLTADQLDALERLAQQKLNFLNAPEAWIP